LAHPSSRMAVKTVELMAKSCGIAELPHLPPVLFSADIYMSENI
jgi:hypothetical protein